MKYVNTATGNTIETECEIAGKNWQPLGAAGKPAAKKPAKKQVEKTEPKAEYDEDDDSDLD